MLRSLRASGRATPMRAVILVSTIAGLSVPLVATEAAAQASASCGELQGILLQRKQIAERLTAHSKGKKQIDAKFACTNFGQLVANGNTLIKWAETNKDWCHIPDNFISGVKADHANAVSIRGRACNVAAKQVQMEKQAREGGGGGLLGGDGLSGQIKIPQGAL